MSPSQSQNRIYQDDRYWNDYNYLRQPAEEIADTEALAYEESVGEVGGEGWDIPGAEGSGYDAETSPRDQLAALQNQVRQSGLSPEQQQNILKELNSLTGLSDGEAFEEKFYELEENFSEKIQNLDHLQETEAKLAELEKIIQDPKNFSEKEIQEFKKRIEEFRQQLEEDPGLDLQSELADVLESTQAVENRVAAAKKEAERTEGMGEAIAAAMDEVFLGKAGGSISAPDAPWYDLRKQVFLDVIGELGPVGGAVGGLLGFVSGFSTDRPSSGLKNSSQAVQDLDLILGGQSQLGSTPAAGEIVRALYNTELSPKEQVDEIKKALGDLPEASQTYILATVVTTLEKQDPEKVTFLKEFAPEAVQFLNKEIKAGMSAIEGGSLAGAGGGGYDVQFGVGQVTIHNTDTAWYRDDWNDFSIPLSGITEPMRQALNTLGEE